MSSCRAHIDYPHSDDEWLVLDTLLVLAGLGK